MLGAVLLALVAAVGAGKAHPAAAQTMTPEQAEEWQKRVDELLHRPPACRIGKPSYCLKYGGSRCTATNARIDRKLACQQWTEGCFDCHRKIPDCLGVERVRADSQQCRDCRETWAACLYASDARHWPNRLRRSHFPTRRETP
jgi:hypothetical protein